MQLSLLFDAAQTPRAYTAADARKAGEVAGQRAADLQRLRGPGLDSLEDGAADLLRHLEGATP